ncbi:MAG: exostosin domain-containing protein [Pontibacterium sp.]
MKISIYSHGHEKKIQKLVPVLEPFFSNNNKKYNYPWQKEAVYKPLWDVAHNYFKTSALEQADIVVIPVDWYWVRGYSWNTRENKELRKYLTEFNEEVLSSGKPVVGFFSGDRSCEKTPLKNTTLFRESAYKSRLMKNSDLPLPAFIEDFLFYYADDDLCLRKKSAKPVVGFCGLASFMDYKNYLKLGVFQARSLFFQQLWDVSPYKGERLRSHMLSVLELDENINSNFIIRDKNTFIGIVDNQDKFKLRQEYVGNITNSDYVLCCRGSGNFSYRLYETLCMGRIPVVIDTDIKLPFDDLINWKEHVVWVEEKDINCIGQIVAEFHENLSDEDFETIQKENRKLWLEWLSPKGFYSNFYRFFE